MARQGRDSADELLAVALAAGATLRDAAQAAGVSERTAARRWDEPEFRRRVSDLRGDLINRVVGQMADGMSEAASALRELLACETPSVRLGACRALLELTVKLRDSLEIEARLNELEARVMTPGDGQTGGQGGGSSP